MIVASYVFYGWWDWHFIFLLAATTLIAIFGAQVIDRQESPVKRRFAMAISVFLALSLLAWFKYYGFFISNIDNTLHKIGAPSGIIPLLSVTLPVGISFFTFMAVSYLVDVYRQDLPLAKPLDVACYLSFFPHLVAGPIVRGAELLPQLRITHSPANIDIGRAFWMIFSGLFKKVVIASAVSSAIVDPVFSTPGSHTSLEVLFAIYGYAVQIWADFSGYTDMAIGIALLLGIKFPQNFDSPYGAASLQDFWRRWNMTLSRWLRDYLYIPLGGNKGSKWKTARNVLITMIVGGLWHGAAWTFVTWGLIHGLGQAVAHLRMSRRQEKGIAPKASTLRSQIIGRVVTFHIVCLAWVFFRANSIGDAFTLLKALFTKFGPAPLFSFKIAALIVAAVAIQQLPRGWAKRVQEAYGKQRLVTQGLLAGCALTLITTLGPPGVAPFIYYRF
ncbi:MAG: MBOAT family protein [Acidimicrobiales bacterium]|nr:MBOAT family protein [Acidimicrobiales bacterium]